MINLPNYHLTAKIYESDNSLVYRGVRTEDNRLVIVKVLRQEYPTPAELICYRQEYDLTHHLELEGAIKAYSWEKSQNTPIIIFEDFSGTALRILMRERRFSLLEFLQIAIKIVQSLGAIHAHQIIHKDINPSNIVFNPQTGQLKLIDFGISTVMTREETNLKNFQVLEGTLAYMSPEQTGRINRYLDYRTDFYSLGVTFYEMLTAQLPFVSEDALELVHFHLAKLPISPHELEPQIPQAVSGIIVKLLAKNAEDRYQSAWGILADLELCLHQLEQTGEIKVFNLGERDISDKLQIPQKLYGREEESKHLLAAFKRVADGNIELILVSGYSGIGKTALVKVLYQPITKLRGYFISGKFEQYQRNIPYSAIIRAFQELIKQILTESENNLIQWREKLQQALVTNGQVIIDIIPEIELIIGKQPPVPKLPPTESENRLRLVFPKFIRVFSKAQHPLAIFIDDLQWADSASLKLIQLLLSTYDSKYLLLVGAYRDNEVNPGHIWMLILEEIRQSGVTVNEIYLAPLSLNQVNEFIADAVSMAPSKTLNFANLVFSKTQGNPFFCREFLQSLYKEKLLYFNYQNKQWQWNLRQIQSINITDNVVDFMAIKLKKLSPNTQELLKIAACRGNQFDLYLLAISADKPLRQTAILLREALVEGLIFPLNNNHKFLELDVALPTDGITIEYKFVHDRIQQAAYSLIPSTQKQLLHFKIGKLLLQSISHQEREGKIFDIVNQLNFSISLINNQGQKNELAQLNLMAGKKAKASAAYQSAFDYLTQGIELLAKDKWKKHYDLTLNLYVEAAELAYLSNRFEEMEQLTSMSLQYSKLLLDKVKIYKVIISAYMAQGKFQEAIQTGMKVLKMLGINLPNKSSKIDVLINLLQTKIILIGKSIENLTYLPEIKILEKKAAMEIINSIVIAAYIILPKLFPILICQGVNLSIKYGNSDISISMYSAYGLILCGAIGDIKSGYKFGNLALNILENRNIQKLAARAIMIVNVGIKHWQEHGKNTLQPLKEGYSIAIETGNIEDAVYCVINYCYHFYFIGQKLDFVEQEIA